MHVFLFFLPRNRLACITQSRNANKCNEKKHANRRAQKKQPNGRTTELHINLKKNRKEKKSSLYLLFVSSVGFEVKHKLYKYIVILHDENT